MGLSDARYHFILDYVNGMALDAIWLYLEDDADSYQDKKGLFIWCLRRMLDEGVVVLAKHGKKIIAPSYIAAQMFERTFPPDEAGIDNGLWFFSEDCPAGIGWVSADGSVDWA